MKTHHFLSKLALTWFFVVLPFLFANSQEVQISFCNSFQEITPKMARKVTQFKDTEGFQTAHLYAAADGSQYIEVVYSKNGKIFREKWPQTPESLAALCNELEGYQDAKLSDEEDFGKDGTRRLITSSMAFSLGYYGWAVPTAFNAEEIKSYVASYLLIGSGGFFIPLLATHNKDVTWGMARGYSRGSFLGIIHGWSLMGILDKTQDIRAALGVSTLSSLAEGIAGYHFAKANNLGYGYISTISSGGTWGAAYGLALPYILAESDNPRVYGLSSLALSGLGLWGGHVLAKNYQISNGDIAVINTAAICGASLPFGVYNRMDNIEPRVRLSAAVFGSVFGMVYGTYRTKSVDYSNQQGNLVALGAAAGSLVGRGFAALADTDAEGALLAGSIGACLGFVITDAVIHPSTIKTSGKHSSAISFNFNPYPLYAAMSGKSQNFSFDNPYAAEQNYLLKMSLQF